MRTDPAVGLTEEDVGRAEAVLEMMEPQALPGRPETEILAVEPVRTMQGQGKEHG